MYRNISSKQIPPVGFGCMGMSEFYGQSDESKSLETLIAAFNLGYRHFDTADMYGYGANERLVAKLLKAFPSNRKDFFISTKCGIVRDNSDKYSVSLNGSREYIRNACDASLKRLGTDYIDLYYLHRIDPNISLEESIGTLKELAIEGKISALGLCEVSSDTLIEANKIHKISALQSEYSLWSRDVESKIIPTCELLDVAFVAFSPLGRGFLTGNIDKSFMDTADQALDFRKIIPRFNGENLDKNLLLVEQLKKIANSIGVTASELSLSWLLKKSDIIHVIPGTKRIDYMKSNFNAQNVTISDSIYHQLNELFAPDAVHGQRYPVKILATTE